MSNSLRKDLIHINSIVTFAIAQYSTPADEQAMAGCLLANQEIRLKPKTLYIHLLINDYLGT